MMDLVGWFYGHFDIANVVLFLLFSLGIVCWTMDRISRRSASTFDDLQSRVSELESRLGIKGKE